MKNIFKSRIFLVILTAFICITGTVYASELFASSISFTPSNPDWELEENTVEAAINDLYNKANNNINIINNSGVFCIYISGTKGAIGSKYACNPGDGNIRYFYILKINTTTIEMIMDRNITNGFVNWNTANNYFTSNNILSSWKNIQNVDLPKAEDIADAVGNENWTINDDWFYLDNNNGSYGQTQVATSSVKSAFSWLYDYTGDCFNYGCNYNSSNTEGAYGYWAKDRINDKAYGVRHKGTLFSYDITDTTSYGIRPVITVLKSNLG